VENVRECDPRAQPPTAASPWPAGRGEEQHAWEAPRILRFERGMGVPVNGLPERLVRRNNRAILRAAGNAVVPQVAAEILRGIIEIEKRDGEPHDENKPD